MTSEQLWQQIVKSLEDKDYRDAFVAAEIETGIPFQIKAMRRSRGWKQKQLAEAAGMSQARISILESADYEGAVNVKTLEKLASTFDVALMVRFVPFSELADWTVRQSAQGHDVPEYAKDEGLRRPETATATVHIGSAFVGDLWTTFLLGAGAGNYAVATAPCGVLNLNTASITSYIVTTGIMNQPVVRSRDASSKLAA